MIHAGFHVSRATQDTGRSTQFYEYGAVTRYGHTFQSVPLLCASHVPVLLPRLCRNTDGLGFSPFARHYSGNHFCFLLLPLLRCFSSRRSPPLRDILADGFPHSGIRGSLTICVYPRLFAAYRALHRLMEPRHPPYALVYFSFVIQLFASDLPVLCSQLVRGLRLTPPSAGSVHDVNVRSRPHRADVRKMCRKRKAAISI